MLLPYHLRLRSSVLTLTVLALGCGKTDQIESYTVDKEPAAEVAAAPATNPQSASPPATPGAAANSTSDRMIAAILPHGDQAWFFKVVGPSAAVDKVANDVAAFFTTIRVKPEDNQVTFRPGPTWQQQAATGMREATLIIPGETPLELTVTRLGWPGGSAAMLSNINRWRGQMKLPPIEESQLALNSSELTVGDAKLTVVDLKGRFESTMAPPFAGGGPFAGKAPFAGGDSAPRPPQTGSMPPLANDANLPPGHPPVAPPNGGAAAAPGNAAPADVPKFELPKTWRELPAEGMRRAAFSVADGNKQALITVTEFSAQVPAMADPLQNVNRWRGEIGLARIDAGSLATATESIEVDGNKATYMAAIPDTAKPEESQVEQATLAAMVRIGDRMWFFKMKGNRDLVAAEQKHFREFLQSVRFIGDRGAPDGN